MKVLINTLSVTPQTFGIRIYLTNLVSALLEADPNIEYVLLCSPLNEDLFDAVVGGRPNGSIITLPQRWNSTLLRFWFDQVVVPRHIRNMEDAVLFTPSNIATFFTKVPQVVVIQAPLSVRAMRKELAYETNGIPKLKPIMFDLLLPLTLRHAKKVVAVSQYQKQKMLIDLPGMEGKIAVVHEGVEAGRFAPQSDGDSSLGSDPYILFVSTLFPYKNLDKLLHAFSRVRSGTALPANLRLKIAGKDPDGHQRSQLEGLARRLGVEEATDFLGMVPHEQIGALYRSALAFVYPSSMETFGLPILEAMSCGIPVVSSDRMSVPEIVGDAGLVIDPDDIDELAQSIERIILDTQLRDLLIARGFRRVEEFSWNHGARKMIELFDSVLSTG